jgi:hypothetical protein
VLCVLAFLGIVVVLESFLFAVFWLGLRGGCIGVPERGMEAAQRSLRFNTEWPESGSVAGVSEVVCGLDGMHGYRVKPPGQPADDLCKYRGFLYVG